MKSVKFWFIAFLLIIWTVFVWFIGNLGGIETGSKYVAKDTYLVFAKLIYESAIQEDYEPLMKSQIINETTYHVLSAKDKDFGKVESYEIELVKIGPFAAKRRVTVKVIRSGKEYIEVLFSAGEHGSLELIE